MGEQSLHYNYLIVGGGMTADAAVQGIREIDFSGRIGIISQESDPPYNRPPLTKGLWFGNPEESIWRKTEQHHVDLHLSKTILSFDPTAHTVTDSSGRLYHYEKLLLATGGSPKKLPFPSDGAIYYRTLADYHRLRNLYQRGNDFIVIGAGYIGSEIAAALAMNGKNVTLIFQDGNIGEHQFPKQFSRFLSAFFTEKGVRLVPKQRATAISRINDKWKVVTNHDETFFADGVIIGIGITPNVDLAEKAGATIDNGIVVDPLLKSSLPDVWAAGDVANFYSPHLDKRVRIEHEDAANTMGKAAGRNMAGAQEPYSYLPFFYSDLFEIGYEGIGEIASDMEIIEEWIEPYREGSIYYLREGKLRGAIFVHVWDQIPKAREMIASQQPFALSLSGGIEFA